MARRWGAGVAALAAFGVALGCGDAEDARRAASAAAPAAAAAAPAEPAAPAAPESGPAPAEPAEPAAAPARAPFFERIAAARREGAALGREERVALWRRRLGIPEDPEERRALREREQARDRELVPRLEAEDAAARAEAVRDVDLQGPGRERVFALAVDDADPAVRAAAVRRLLEEDAPTARQLAQRSLGDRDADVVLVSIEVLEVVGDASSAALLEPLAAGHEDPRVREAAAETIAFLR